MDILEQDRIHTATLFFAKKYYERFKSLPTAKQVYNFLLLADFSSAKQRGRPIFGLLYYEQPILIPAEPVSADIDLDCFADTEIEIMEDILKGVFNYPELLNAEINLKYEDVIDDECLMDIFEGYKLVEELKREP